MSASIRLNAGTAIVFDAIKQTGATPRAVLLTLEGKTPGQIMNCAIIPLDKIRAVIASLELVASQAEKA